MYQTLYTFFEDTLFWLARQTLTRFTPTIIGVTGSVGKTSTKHAIATVLSGFRTTRVSKGNLNTEIGVCLTILGEWNESDLALVSRATPSGQKRFEKALFWARVFLRGFWNLLLLPRHNYPETVILEYGADRPGDIKKLLRIARPDIAVISAIGTMPVHVEFYANPDELAREKAKLIEAVSPSGYAIINADDEVVMGLRERTRARLYTFGFSEKATVRITNFEHKIIDEVPVGICFKLEQKTHFVPVRIGQVYGTSHAYATAAAATVGVAMGMNLVSISQRLSEYRPVAGRMNLIPGIKDTLILDDAYNASPLSMAMALQTLQNLPATRKIAVLGDMLELGKYSFEAHAAIGAQVAPIADILVTVGLRGKLIAEAAMKARMNKKNVYSFDTATEAEAFVVELVKPEDLILIKGSHGTNVFEIVSALATLDAG